MVPGANAANDDPAFIKLGAGDVGSCCADRDQAGAFSIEYRAGPDLELLHIRPSLGVLGTTDASVYGWFGLSGDIFFGRRLVLNLGSAVGFYFEYRVRRLIQDGSPVCICELARDLLNYRVGPPNVHPRPPAHSGAWLAHLECRPVDATAGHARPSVHRPQ